MHRLTSFYASIDWTDPRIISAVALIWFAAVGYLIFWIIDDRHRAPETDDEEEREQQPETDETQTEVENEPGHGGSTGAAFCFHSACASAGVMICKIRLAARAS